MECAQTAHASSGKRTKAIERPNVNERTCASRKISNRRNRETGEYHLYVTNVPPEKLAAEDIGAVHLASLANRTVFKELKSHYRIEDMPSSKRLIVEVLLYAAFLTMVVSRRLLALVRRRLAAMADRIPEERWAAVFVPVARELLTAATQPLGAVRLLLYRLERVLLHEAIDPNAARHSLLACALRAIVNAPIGAS